jgi:hypothetical protein
LLCLIVEMRTAGRSGPADGRGNTAAALARRAVFLCLRLAGRLKFNLTLYCHDFLKWTFGTTLLLFTIFYDYNMLALINKQWHGWTKRYMRY